MLLEKFKTAKQPEIQALRQLEYINMLPLPLRIERPSFLNALCAPNGNRPHVIAEFKRASPSRGDILMDFPPEEAAKQYAEAGASCLRADRGNLFQGHARVSQAHVRARTAFVAEGLHL